MEVPLMSAVGSGGTKVGGLRDQDRFNGLLAGACVVETDGTLLKSMSLRLLAAWLSVRLVASAPDDRSG